MKKGEVTAFLSLIFILLLSVTASIIESASVQVTKNRRRGDMDRALESVFAEYQVEMLEEYEIFTLEGTYETGDFSEQNIAERLAFYGMKDTEQTIEKIQFLTDDSGRGFREQVIAYMKHKMGISQVEDLAGLSDAWEEQEQRTEQYKREEEALNEEIETSLNEQELELPEEDNPVQVIDNIKKTGLLRVVMKDETALSNKAIQTERMPSHRTLRQGRGEFKVRSDTRDAVSNLYFTNYILDRFSAADEPGTEGKLAYELEYILNGAGSDRENLETVVNKLVAGRFAANYGYLLTDEVKKGEAQAMALAIAGIIALPALTAAIKHAILLAWAFGESLMDVRTLLSGGKVSLIKTQEDWQLTLSALLKLGTEEDRSDGRSSEKGLSYKEYLRILLLLENQNTCTMRTIDLAEMNMRNKLGEFFQADACISKLQIKSRCSLRRNVYYEFLSDYGYQ